MTCWNSIKMLLKKELLFIKVKKMVFIVWHPQEGCSSHVCALPIGTSCSHLKINLYVFQYEFLNKATLGRLDEVVFFFIFVFFIF